MIKNKTDVNPKLEVITNSNSFRDLVYVGENQLEANDIVLKLRGEVLNSPTRESIQIKPNEHIFDEIGQFINHDCNPTCKVLGKTIVVINKLSKGDSITFDYNLNEYVVAFPFYCNCHHKMITGRLKNSLLDTTPMNEPWVDRWNERFGQEEFAYGISPNNFLKEQLLKFKPGNILFPAEGEGRNAVFAAKLGWIASAFDISIEGKKKAERLAESEKVDIDFQVGELQTLNFKNEQFDAIALIYAHFPANLKSQIHISLNQYLKKGGYVIFEAFSKNHLQYLEKNDKVGGPKDYDMLFSLDEIKADFANFDTIELEEKVIELNEGLFHNGTGSVIRFVGRKK